MISLKTNISLSCVSQFFFFRQFFVKTTLILHKTYAYCFFLTYLSVLCQEYTAAQFFTLSFPTGRKQRKREKDRHPEDMPIHLPFTCIWFDKRNNNKNNWAWLIGCWRPDSPSINFLTHVFGSTDSNFYVSYLLFYSLIISLIVHRPRKDWQQVTC